MPLGSPSSVLFDEGCLHGHTNALVCIYKPILCYESIRTLLGFKAIAKFFVALSKSLFCVPAWFPELVHPGQPSPGCVFADTVPAITFVSHPPDSFFPSFAALSCPTHPHKDGACLKNGEEQSFFSSLNQDRWFLMLNTHLTQKAQFAYSLLSLPHKPFQINRQEPPGSSVSPGSFPARRTCDELKCLSSQQ